MTEAFKAGGIKPATGPVEVLREETQEAMAGPLSPLTLGPALVDLAVHVATAPAYVVEMAAEAARQGLKTLAVDGDRRRRATTIDLPIQLGASRPSAFSPAIFSSSKLARSLRLPCAGRFRAPRRTRRLCGAAMARRLFALQPALDQSRNSARHGATGGTEFFSRFRSIFERRAASDRSARRRRGR